MSSNNTIIFASDLHVLEAGSSLLEYRASELPDARIVLLGDRTINPDFSETNGHDLLREAKIQAKEQGADSRKARDVEDELWEGKNRDVLARQWSGTIESTYELHSMFERAVAQGVLPVVTDTGGNDFDKDWRVEKARAVLNDPTLSEASLSDIVNDSFAFDMIQKVESLREGNELLIMIPYTETQHRDTLLGYSSSIRAAINQAEAVERITLLGHQNPDPELRREFRTEWYTQMYQAIQSIDPHLNITHIFGHSHKIPEPYEKHGILFVPIGYGKDENQQRIVTLDLDSGTRKYKDFDLPAQHEATQASSHEF